MLSSFKPNRTCRPGDWMSVSTTPTCRPWPASRAATLAVVLDLPVPPRNECTAMIVDMAVLSSTLVEHHLHAIPGPQCQRRVRFDALVGRQGKAVPLGDGPDQQ